MKKICIKFAALAVAFGITFAPQTGLAQVVYGGIIPTGIPAKLPIGSEKECLNWIVSRTNGLPNSTFTFKVLYYDVNNKPLGFSVAGSGAYNNGFTSYEDYLTCAETESKSVLKRMIDAKNAAPGSRVFFRTSVDYCEYGGVPMSGLFTDTKLGTYTNMDLSLLKKLYVKSEYVVVPFPGMTKARIEIGIAPQLSWYEWNQGKISYSSNTSTTVTWPSQYENTTDKYLILSSWYCMGTNKVRIYVTANNRTYAYTEFGEMLRPPVLSINSRQVSVSAARGAEVFIETSPDLVHWSPMVAESPTPTSNSTVSTKLFYRAYCR